MYKLLLEKDKQHNDKHQAQTYHIQTKQKQKKQLSKGHYSVLAKSKIFVLISFTIRCTSIHHVYFHRKDDNLDINV